MPTKQSSREQNKERYEKRLKDTLDSGVADDLTINFAISRGDFERARKLIAKLRGQSRPDGGASRAPMGWLRRRSRSFSSGNVKT